MDSTQPTCLLRTLVQPPPALPAAPAVAHSAPLNQQCAAPHQRLAYSYAQAAEQISISERGLRDLVAAGHIKAIGYGNGRRRVGITHQALVSWVADRETYDPV